MASPTPWFVQAFGPLYAQVYNTRNDALAQREAEFLAQAMLLRSGVRVLDIACGEGRHLRALASRGAQLFGVDLSRSLLGRAVAGGARVVRGDMRALPFADNAFSAACSLFSSFGYFSAEEDQRVLEEARRVLQPGGRYVLDLADPEAVVRSLVPDSERVVEGMTIHEHRRVEGRFVLKQVRCLHGQVQEAWEERLRLYTVEEVRALLNAAGFREVAIVGGLFGEALCGASRHVHVVERAA